MNTDRVPSCITWLCTIYPPLASTIAAATELKNNIVGIYTAFSMADLVAA